jgi:hypothetical protein
MNTLRLFVFLASLIGSFEMLYAATDSSNNLFETEAKDEIILKNNSYSIKIIKKLKGAPSIEIQRLDEKTISRKLSPTLTVIYAVKDPVYGRGGISEGSSPVASWGGQREINLWEQGEQIVLTATGLLVHDEQTVIFQFAEQEKFVIELKVNLPEESAAPEFSWSIKAKKNGWYSVGFTGIEAQNPTDLDFLYQPLVWSWKRFPSEAVLTPEAYATSAASFTTSHGLTEGIAVPSKEIPYRFANFNNSRFGIALRTKHGQAKPMIFSPILGGASSQMQTGDQYHFSIQYFVQEGDWNKGIDYLYRKILNYHNERQNATVSLNKTLENMIDFAMDDVYGGWVKELKGSDYKFDVPGTVKNVSALHPLSIALTTGNQEIYDRRALPMIEYMMSRQKYLYSVSDTIVLQNPSHFLKGPCMEIGELVSLYQMTGNQNYVFKAEANRIFGKPRQLNLKTATGGDSWQDYLAKYRMENSPDLIETAIQKADKYVENTIEEYPENFNTNAGLSDKQATFSIDYSNRWQDLLELYEETGKKSYLDAAHLGAKQFLLWTRSNPMAPDTTIVVNKNGNVPGVFPGRRHQANSYEWKEFDTSTDIQEQVVPGWHTSLVGLPPEQPYTYLYGPIMLNHQAAPMLRLAHLKNDQLLRDVAYNGIIGRYANFPGYYFTSLSTNVYQQSDYPLHNYLDIKYNAIFYNHIWPHIALLQDFLVSDAYYRSAGKIEFPSAYAPGYAFLISKVYGHKPGEIFGNKNVNLWLPKNAIQSSEFALNHLFGRDEQNTYLVLMNTADRKVDSELFLNPDAIKWNYGATYPTVIYQSDGKQSEGEFLNGKINIEVPAKGLIAIKIEGLKNEVPLQEKVLKATLSTQNEGYFRKDYLQPALGTVTGMLLNLVSGFSDAYLYSSATEKETNRVTLHYQLGDGVWQNKTDDKYPFEFSIRIDEPQQSLKIKWEALDQDGNSALTEKFTLVE